MFTKQFGNPGPVLVRALPFAALAGLMAAGCDSPKQGRLHDISGHLPSLQFSLTSDTGQAVTNFTYRGYVIFLFFGFTHCHDQCPTAMSRLAALLPHLGDKAKDVRILFVTLNPDRDTPEILHRYATTFDPVHAIGLTGSEDEIEGLVKRYRIAYRPGESDSDDIVHSVAVYVFDPEGRARLLIRPEDSNEAVANAVLPLLNSAG